MIGLNFYVEPIKPETYWVGVKVTLPAKAAIVTDATAVIIEDAVVREQTIETNSDTQEVSILLNVYTKKSNVRGYIKTVVCEDACKPEKLEFDLDLKNTPHFYHKQWAHTLSSSSSLWSVFVFVLMMLGAIFLIGLIAFLITMGFMFGLYLFALIAGLYVAVFMLLAMAGAVRNVYEFCTHYWSHEFCMNSKVKPSKIETT